MNLLSAQKRRGDDVKSEMLENLVGVMGQLKGDGRGCRSRGVPLKSWASQLYTSISQHANRHASNKFVVQFAAKYSIHPHPDGFTIA